MRHRLRIIKASEIVALVTARGKVHTGREGAVGVGFGILPVAPLHLEALLVDIVGHALVTGLGVLKTGIESAVVTIALAIVAGGTEPP